MADSNYIQKIISEKIIDKISKNIIIILDKGDFWYSLYGIIILEVQNEYKKISDSLCIKNS